MLSAIHSAKGLEFEAVFVIGLAEGRFPHAAASFGEQWEERRLLYVAVTRAEAPPYLTYPKQLIQDRQFQQVGMSPFLGEIDRVITAGPQGEGHWVSIMAISLGPARACSAAAPGGQRPSSRPPTCRWGPRSTTPFWSWHGCQKTVRAAFPRYPFRSPRPQKTLHLDYAKLTIL